MLMLPLLLLLMLMLMLLWLLWLLLWLLNSHNIIISVVVVRRRQQDTLEIGKRRGVIVNNQVSEEARRVRLHTRHVRVRRRRACGLSRGREAI